MPDLNENETEHMAKVPNAPWYKFTLACSHIVYSRVRLKYEKPGRQYHTIRCPQCDINKARAATVSDVPTAWNQVETVEASSDAEVSNVLSGTAFVLPNRIMRLDYNGGPGGNPFPYTSREREY